MGRRRLEPGELGEISYKTVTRADGRSMIKARSRYRDSGGVTKRLSAEGKTRAAAKNSLKLKHKDLLNSGAALGAEAPTVAQAVENYLSTLQIQDLEHKVRGARYVTQGTMRQYNRSAAIATKVLGDVRLGDLTVQYAQRQLEALVDPVTLEGAAAAKQAKNLLMRAIADAQRVGHIAGNPIQAVQLPTKGRAPVNAPTSDDLTAWRAAFGWYFDDKQGATTKRMDERVRWVTELLLATGMRIGEAMALRWQDIDFQNRRVKITGTLVENGALARQGYPKTESSTGSLALPDKTVGMLIKLHSRTKWKAASDPVFATRTGNYAAPTSIRRSLRRISELYPKNLPMPDLAPHDLRRAVATHIAEVAGIESASKQLRHASQRRLLHIILSGRKMLPTTLVQSKDCTRIQSRAT